MYRNGDCLGQVVGLKGGLGTTAMGESPTHPCMNLANQGEQTSNAFCSGTRSSINSTPKPRGHGNDTSSPPGPVSLGAPCLRMTTAWVIPMKMRSLGRLRGARRAMRGDCGRVGRVGLG